MYGLSLPHLLVLALVVLVLFGRGRVSATMGDFGKGIREFRRGMSDDNDLRLPTSESGETSVGVTRSPETPGS